MQKALSLVVVLSLLTFSFPAIACGCGVLILASDQTSGWKYGHDTAEYAYIAHNNGVENLLIELELQSRDVGAVLVTPVPAQADLVKSDILTESVDVSGYDIFAKAKDNIKQIRTILLGTQYYPLPIMTVWEMLQSSVGTTDAPRMMPTVPLGSNGVTVHQRVEKAGLIAEVLSAETSDALYEYLTQKGLRVKKDSIPIFKDYIRDDFAFVAAWINPNETNVGAKALSITFPTEKIFYPLKPNSAYSSTAFPRAKIITVFDYVTPHIYPAIQYGTRVEYQYSESGLKFNPFIDTQRGFGFTTIIVNASPINMTEDIYMDASPPFKVILAHLINKFVIFFGLMIYAVAVLLGTGVALGFLRPVMVEPRRLPYKLFLSNFLTLIGTVYAAKRYLVTKKGKYVVMFSLVFIISVLSITHGLDEYFNY